MVLPRRPSKFRPLPVLLATMVVLFAAIAWIGTTWALNGSLWRMPKIIAAGAKEAGCVEATVSGQRRLHGPPPNTRLQRTEDPLRQFNAIGPGKDGN